MKANKMKSAAMTPATLVTRGHLLARRPKQLVAERSRHFPPERRFDAIFTERSAPTLDGAVVRPFVGRDCDDVSKSNPHFSNPSYCGKPAFVPFPVGHSNESVTPARRRAGAISAARATSCWRSTNQAR